MRNKVHNREPHRKLRTPRSRLHLQEQGVPQWHRLLPRRRLRRERQGRRRQVRPTDMRCRKGRGPGQGRVRQVINCDGDVERGAHGNDRLCGCWKGSWQYFRARCGCRLSTLVNNLGGHTKQIVTNIMIS